MVFPEFCNSLSSVDYRQRDQQGAALKTHVIPAAHGYAFQVKKGEHFRVVDLYGEQVVDFAAWVQGTDLREKLSMAYTRFHLDGV
ncbi:hypothetical protein KC318_g20231, partial [Hortaea werneckii]